LVPAGGKKEQGPTATLAFLAFLAMWFVQLTDSKGGPRDRIPLSQPNCKYREINDLYPLVARAVSR
jgi:hypothetical protein